MYFAEFDVATPSWMCTRYVVEGVVCFDRLFFLLFLRRFSVCPANRSLLHPVQFMRNNQTKQKSGSVNPFRTAVPFLGRGT